jgi:hypothetical protein
VLSKQHFFLLLSFFALCILIYLPTFSVPFYLDDFDSIVNNETIKTLSWQAVEAQYPMRELGYFSFALNYAMHADNVFGYHLVNLALHLLMGLGVFLLVTELTKYTQLEKKHATGLAILSAALFLLAPLNTQAVTYIVQRLALLSAIFYIYAMVCYLFARQSATSKGALFYYLLFVVCFIGGLHSKQNIVTLPLTLLVLEFWLIRKAPTQLLKIIGILLVGVSGFGFVDWLAGWDILAKLDAATTEAFRLSRWEYFTHQLSALWMYFYKFFVPYPLLLEYSSTANTWADAVTWLAALGHVGIIVIGVVYRNRAPLLTVLPILFYISHSVESSFIPISDLVVEHRSYLPNTFVAFGAAYLLYLVFGQRKYLGIGLAVILLTEFVVLSYQRNTLWQTPLEFYRNELTHTADNSRAYGAVGLLYARAGNDRKAERWFKMAVQVGAETNHMQIATVLQYMQSLLQSGKPVKANRIGALALKVATRNIDKAKILVVLATIKASQGHCEFAESLKSRSVTLAPELGDVTLPCTQTIFEVNEPLPVKMQ